MPLFIKIDEYGDVVASLVRTTHPGDPWLVVPNDGKHGPTTLIARPRQYMFEKAGGGTVKAFRRREVKMMLNGTRLKTGQVLRISVKGLLHGESVRVLVDREEAMITFGQGAEFVFTSPGLVKVRMKDRLFYDRGYHRGNATVRVNA